MSRIFTLVVGTLFFVVGLMGWLQEPLVSDGFLYGVFAVNPVHDVIRMVAGILGVLAYATGWSRIYCEILGFFFLLVGFLWFVPGLATGDMLLGFVEVTWANIVLYLVVGAAAVASGFVPPHGRQSPLHTDGRRSRHRANDTRLKS